MFRSIHCSFTNTFVCSMTAKIFYVDCGIIDTQMLAKPMSSSRKRYNLLLVNNIIFVYSMLFIILMTNWCNSATYVLIHHIHQGWLINSYYLVLIKCKICCCYVTYISSLFIQKCSYNSSVIQYRAEISIAKSPTWSQKL